MWGRIRLFVHTCILSCLRCVEHRWSFAHRCTLHAFFHGLFTMCNLAWQWAKYLQHVYICPDHNPFPANLGGRTSWPERNPWFLLPFGNQWSGWFQKAHMRRWNKSRRTWCPKRLLLWLVALFGTLSILVLLVEPSQTWLPLGREMRFSQLLVYGSDGRCFCCTFGFTVILWSTCHDEQNCYSWTTATVEEWTAQGRKQLFDFPKIQQLLQYTSAARVNEDLAPFLAASQTNAPLLLRGPVLDLAAAAVVVKSSGGDFKSFPYFTSICPTFSLQFGFHWLLELFCKRIGGIRKAPCKAAGFQRIMHVS